MKQRGNDTMKLTRILLAVALLAGMAGLAYVAQQVVSPGLKMANAAQKFLSSLNDEQKAKAAFDFDSKERTRWFFVPLQDKNRKPTRKGLPLEEMNADQKKAALALVAAGTSDLGNKQALTIMSLEAILRDQEKKGAMVRNPEWYFFCIFGTPSKTGKWGWRVEGHHLSLNFTMEGGQVLTATPSFYGANPAEVKGGPNKGKRVLAQAEDLAFQLFKALDADQKKIAYQAKQFNEIEQATVVDSKVGEPVGLTAAKMTEQQRVILLKLLHAYTRRMPEAVADAEWKHVKEGGIDKIHFAYNGADHLGKKHTYRVQGPTFVVEFLNEQGDSGGNPANHIHSVWRRIKGDFGIN
jgi:hypothetical protein